ncbi:MAG: hypothetical protein HUK20_00155 [Fibrobacter sp.]|nr:hypothetical protein [Fibrobacter sp.]
MKKITIAAFFAILFAGCALPPDVRMDPTWKEVPKTVEVQYSEPLVENLDDVKDDLADYADKFGSWFSTAFDSVMKAKTKSEIQMSLKDDNYFKSSRDTVNNKTVAIPTAEISSDKDVILMMNPIKVLSTMETSQDINATPGMPGATTGGYTTQKYLVYDVQFAYYDAKTQKRLGFGNVYVKQAPSFALTRSDWYENMGKLVDAVIKGSPWAPAK